jgi:hypothetical protein
MNPRKIRSLFVLTLIVAIAAGAFYMNFNRSAASAIPAPLAMEGAAEGASILTAGAPTTGQSGPIVGTPVQGVSFDGDLRDLPQVGPGTQRLMREMISPLSGEPTLDGSAVDPVAQTFNAIEAMPGTGVSFAGLDLSSWGAGWPPDTNGDVGPAHYIQTVNTSIGIYDKATGVALTRITFNNLFAGTGTPCDAQNMGDPVVLYDQVSGRWILTDFAWSSTRGPFYECIAVSKTADPVSGGWWFYALLANSTQLPDYPKLGVWPDGIYMSANMFTRAKTYAGVKVWVFDRNQMINGTLRSVAFTLGTSYFSLIPSTVSAAHMASVPTGIPNYFLSDYGLTTSMRMWKFHVDWVNTSLSTFTGPTSIAVPTVAKPTARVPQLGSSTTLDTLGDRLMVQLQFTNVGGVPALWVSRTAVSNSVSAIRWYEIRNMTTTPTYYQAGTYQPDSLHRWMPSLAVDVDGNMAVGYSVSSSAMYPAIRYAGRL